MQSNFAPTRNTYTTGDRRWVRSLLETQSVGVDLDGSKFTAGTVVPSGTVLGRNTTSKLVSKYTPGATDGTQKAVGILLNDWVAAPGKHLVSAVVGGGPLDRRYFPTGSGLDAGAETALSSITFIN